MCPTQNIFHQTPLLVRIFRLNLSTQRNYTPVLCGRASDIPVHWGHCTPARLRANLDIHDMHSSFRYKLKSMDDSIIKHYTFDIFR